MASGDGARSPRHLLALFLGTTFVLLMALGWLGWQSLQQDRRVESQQVQDRLDSAIDQIAAQVRQNLVDIEEQLNRLSVLPSEALEQAAADYSKALGGDALIVVFEGQRVLAYPPNRLLYYPVLSSGPDAPLDRFVYGENLEFKDSDFASASAYFEKLASTTEMDVRAGALMRLARNQKKAGRLDSALATYRQLSEVKGAFLAGWPADLRGRKGECDVLEQLTQRDALVAAANKLNADLHTGRWQLTRATFAFLTSEVRRWLGTQPASAARGTAAPAAPGAYAGALAVAANVDSAWERWQRDRNTADVLGTQGNAVARDRATTLLSSRGTTNRLVTLVSGREFLHQHVVGPINDLLERLGVGLIFEDGEGQQILAHRVPPTSAAQTQRRSMAETRLPWALRVVSADPEADTARFAMRRWLLIGGLSLLALLAVSGSYFSVRAITREIQAARLQSDFVAAVSHEFRTPLTSLRQFTDLLADGRVSDEADRQKYYEVLQRGNRRLTRLVENLLDFGRMEAGFYRFVLEPVYARDVIARVTAEFIDEIRPRGYEVDVQWKGAQDAQIQADEATLGRAIWNLLDNAVKYSPDCKTIWVEGVTTADQVRINVRDHGIGIPATEQRTVFRKFVRGTLPTGTTIKGTGLGLALVDQIVRAHGGRVQLESIQGEGSTFSIVLPLMPVLEASGQPRTAEARS